MRLSVAAMAAGAVLSLAGCAASDSDQISAKVQQLAHAVGRHDYSIICGQVLAPSLVAHLVSNGISCPQAMQVALQGVQEPAVSVGKIEIRGSQATAITLTVARGQQASLAAIDLVKTSQGWRISSLGSPLTRGNTGG
jgi:hypothetical protein